MVLCLSVAVVGWLVTRMLRLEIVKVFSALSHKCPAILVVVSYKWPTVGCISRNNTNALGSNLRSNRYLETSIDGFPVGGYSADCIRKRKLCSEVSRTNAY